MLVQKKRCRVFHRRIYLAGKKNPAGVERKKRRRRNKLYLPSVPSSSRLLPHPPNHTTWQVLCLHLLARGWRRNKGKETPNRGSLGKGRVSAEYCIGKGGVGSHRQLPQGKKKNFQPPPVLFLLLAHPPPPSQFHLSSPYPSIRQRGGGMGTPQFLWSQGKDKGERAVASEVKKGGRKRMKDAGKMDSPPPRLTVAG